MKYTKASTPRPYSPTTTGSEAARKLPTLEARGEAAEATLYAPSMTVLNASFSATEVSRLFPALCEKGGGGDMGGVPRAAGMHTFPFTQNPSEHQEGPLLLQECLGGASLHQRLLRWCCAGKGGKGEANDNRLRCLYALASPLPVPSGWMGSTAPSSPSPQPE